MAISAHINDGRKLSDSRRSTRKTLNFETVGAISDDTVAHVLIHNISATGLLLETAASLDLNERIDIELPAAGLTAAAVVWTSGNLYGCKFDAAISQATLSAAELKSAALPGISDASRPERAGESFGARLARLRNAKGLTLAQVGDHLGVSKPTVWAWENDRAKPASKRIDALAEMLEVPAQDLVRGGDASALDELLARTREQIAIAYGISTDKVRIVIEL